MVPTYQKYGLRLSSGTVSFKIYNLVNHDVIKDEMNDSRKAYVLTYKEEAALNSVPSDPLNVQFLKLFKIDVVFAS